MRTKRNTDKVSTLINADEAKSVETLSAETDFNREVGRTILKKNLNLKPSNVIKQCNA